MDHFFIVFFFMLSMHLSFCDDLIFVIEYSTPGFSYPKSEIIKWNKGNHSTLADSGLRQQYLLGREIRKLYMEDAKLLSDRYNQRNQISIRTLATPAAISSTYAQLMGLYTIGTGDLITEAEKSVAIPPVKFDYSPWIEELASSALNSSYQTVPISEYSGIKDYLLNAAEDCEGVKQMISEVTDRSGNLINKHKELINRLTKAFDLNSS